MKAKEIQDLINFISDTGLEEVDLETEQIKLKIKRSAVQQVTTVSASAPAPAPVAAAPAPTPAPTPAPAASTGDGSSEPATSGEGNLVTVKSSMIGTFYRSQNPETPPFVNVGDSIKEGQTVCIIEAMKLFNEIEADVSGKIVKVLVENAQPVEFDQPLFLVDPS